VAAHIESGIDEPQRFADLGCPGQPTSGEEVIRAGQEAWKRLSSGRTWTDWGYVGAALDIGQAEAMRMAHTNKPEGCRFNAEYGTWLKATGFDQIDKSTRSRLLSCCRNIHAIEQWLATLPTNKRLALNHPHSVWRAWQRTQVPKPADTPKKPSHVARLNAALIESQEEVARLKRDVERNGDGDRWTPQSRPSEVAAVILGTFKDWACREIACEINRGLKKKTAEG